MGCDAPSTLPHTHLLYTHARVRPLRATERSRPKAILTCTLFHTYIHLPPCFTPYHQHSKRARNITHNTFHNQTSIPRDPQTQSSHTTSPHVTPNPTLTHTHAYIHTYTQKQINKTQPSSEINPSYSTHSPLLFPLHCPKVWTKAKK